MFLIEDFSQDHSEDYSVHRGIMDYTVHFPDGNMLRIAPMQQLLVQRAGHHIPLSACEATNQEIVDAAIMIRDNLVEDSIGRHR